MGIFQAPACENNNKIRCFCSRIQICLCCIRKSLKIRRAAGIISKEIYLVSLFIAYRSIYYCRIVKKCYLQTIFFYDCVMIFLCRIMDSKHLNFRGFGMPYTQTGRNCRTSQIIDPHICHRNRINTGICHCIT